LALSRAATHAGHDVRILTNSALATQLPLPAGVEIIDPKLDRRGVADEVRRRLSATQVDVLVVDTFPRGLAGELLPLPRAPLTVFTHRDLAQEYLQARDVAGAVDEYDLILVPGEPAPFAEHDRAVATEPWLICDAADLLPREAARAALGLGEGIAVAVIASGNSQEIRELRTLAGELPFTAFIFEPGGDAPWPALRYLRGFDAVIGGGGYNTVHEARSVGVAFFGFARPRRYDRQRRRLRSTECVGSRAALIRRLGELDECRTEPAYINGAHTAVVAIERALSGEAPATKEDS